MISSCVFVDSSIFHFVWLCNIFISHFNIESYLFNQPVVFILYNFHLYFYILWEKGQETGKNQLQRLQKIRLLQDNNTYHVQGIYNEISKEI